MDYRTALRFTVLTTACSLAAACSPVAEASQSSAPAPVLTAIPSLIAPSATPDTRLAELQAAASIGLTATAQAGIDAQSTLSAVANAADVTATAVMYRAVETQWAATESAMHATQTQEPISARETQDAKTQGMIDAAATRIAGQADAYTVRRNAIEHENWRQWIFTGAVALLGCVVVGGAYVLVEAGRKLIEAKAEGVNATERARARADDLKAQTDREIALGRLALEREKALEATRAAAWERERIERGALSENAQAADAVDDDDLAEYAPEARPVVKFLIQASEKAPDGWRSATIPTARYWGGNGTRSRGVELLRRHGLVDAERGEGGETRLVGYRSLWELKHALRVGALQLDPPTLEATPLAV